MWSSRDEETQGARDARFGAVAVDARVARSLWAVSLVCGEQWVTHVHTLNS